MKTVLCHGVFDVVHPGHLEHFRQAKAHGDLLIVGIVADAYVRKGRGRPLFDENRRRDFLLALRIVDQVHIIYDSGAMPLLNNLRPDVYCKGPDYDDPTNPFLLDFLKEKAFVESYGGKVILTTGFSSSSTAIIDKAGLRPVPPRRPDPLLRRKWPPRSSGWVWWVRAILGLPWRL